MKLTVTVGDYSPTTHTFSGASPSEALHKLADILKSYEGTRNPYPTADGNGPNTLLVEYLPGDRVPGIVDGPMGPGTNVPASTTPVAARRHGA